MATKKSNTKKGNCKSYAEQHRAIERRLHKVEDGGNFDLILAEKLREIEARAIYDVIQICSPDFIMQALYKAIDEAADSCGLPKPMFGDEEGKPARAIQKLADILTMAHNFKPRTEDPDSKEALARHISAVLNHPLVPPAIHNDLWEATSEAFTEVSDGVDKSAEYFLLSLNALESQEGATS